MKQLILSLLIGFSSLCSLQAQKFFTKKALIKFESNAPLEKIKAKNHAATCVINTESGAVQFAVLIKAFKFKKALMQEHFNENYMESDKYPKAVFKGKITNLEAINFEKDGVYATTVKGKMTMHGVKKDLTAKGKIIVKSGKPTLKSTFKVLVADYAIKIPKVVRKNIAKVVTITVEAALNPLKKK